jgi:NAD(P)-dependent dehydrogenase (short-subunit alcohol dehydrogenase family)
VKLQGKVAIVTGAAGGMGEATAILFAREGAKVAVVDLKEEAAQPTVEKIRLEGGTAIAIGADVTCTADVERIVARTVAELGPPTVLVNHAGVDTENNLPVHEVSEAAFDRVVEVNLKGPWLMMKPVVPHMIAAGGGSIVNTASIGAFIAALTAGYCASKAGLVALSRVGAVQLARHNIRVNSLCPGATMSPMTEKELQALKDHGLFDPQAIYRMSALGRMAEPMEQAKATLFLACDDSSFVTGAPLIVDGGWTSLSGVATTN